VNVGLADDPFPLTPTLSLGEREKTLCSWFKGSMRELVLEILTVNPAPHRMGRRRVEKSVG